MGNKTNTNVSYSNTLTYEEKSNVESKIDVLRNKYIELEKTDFDLALFLQKYFDFTIVESKLNDDTTGLILIDDKKLLPFNEFSTHRLIVVNESLSNLNEYYQKRRFIIAHEFAHFILHKKSKDLQFAKRDNEHFNEKEEQEAEYFARSLLMPKEKVLNVVNKLSNSSAVDKIKAVEMLFNVSENKAMYRLQELGLI